MSETVTPSVKDQIRDLDDVLPQEYLDQYVDRHNELAREDGSRTDIPEDATIEERLAAERQSLAKTEQIELKAKQQLFDEAVKNGDLSPNAIQEMRDAGNGYIKIVTFKGESFTGTRYQVRGLVEGVTGMEERFGQILRGEKIEREKIDINDPQAVDRRVTELVGEADAKKVIREHRIDVDLRDPNLVNNPNVPQGLREAAKSPDFQALVKSKSITEMSTILSRQDEGLRDFVRSPQYKEALDFMDSMTSRGGTENLTSYLSKNFPQWNEFAAGKKSLGAVSSRMQKVLQGSEYVKVLQQMRRDPVKAAEMLATQPDLLSNLQQELNDQLLSEWDKFASGNQRLQELAMQFDLNELPGMQAMNQYTRAVSGALQRQVESWGLFDDAPTSRRLSRSTIDSSSINFTPRGK